MRNASVRYRSMTAQAGTVHFASFPRDFSPLRFRWRFPSGAIWSLKSSLLCFSVWVHIHLILQIERSVAFEVRNRFPTLLLLFSQTSGGRCALSAWLLQCQICRRFLPRTVVLAISIPPVVSPVRLTTEEEAMSQRRNVNSRRYRKLILAWLDGEQAKKGRIQKIFLPLS